MYTKNVYSVLNKVASTEEPTSRIRGYLAKRADKGYELNHNLEAAAPIATARAEGANAKLGKFIGKNKPKVFTWLDFVNNDTGELDESKLNAVLRAARRHGKDALDTYGKDFAYAGGGLGIGALAGALAMRKNRALGGLLGAILGTGAGIGTKYLVDKYGNDVVDYVKGLRGKTEQA